MGEIAGGQYRSPREELVQCTDHQMRAATTMWQRHVDDRAFHDVLAASSDTNIASESTAPVPET
jgi:hypothetical protein